MEYLKNKLISIAFLFITLSFYGQSYNYVYTDPCTLVSKTINIPNGSAGITVNYFGNVKTFNSTDFSSGAFETWIATIAQMNSSSPCQSVTTTIVNNINNITVANTVSVVTSVISVASVAQAVASVTAGAVSSSAGGVASSVGNLTPQVDTPTAPSTPSTPTNTSTGTPTGSSTSSSTGSSSSTSSESSSGGGSNLSNSVSNASDGGSADGSSASGGESSDGGGGSGGSSSGRSKANQANKNIGSLIASGDIVAISNTDNTQNVRIVGSITHANTAGTRIKGVLFSYTTGATNVNATFYKSWINKSRKLNTVVANTFMADFKDSYINTLTVLESYKMNKVTGMFGLNFTAGKMGQRTLLNLSAVGGVHSNFKVSDRLGTGILVLGVYSPFTQYFEGKWWDAGILLVPFNSWDIKITKNFKLNVSLTGVYELNKSFLNYQVLTGGKLNF